MELRKANSLSPELLAKIRRLHISTRRLMSHGIAGQYRSAFRGRGIEFEEVREYTVGDDVRAIDWKVTARSRKPFIKSYREERELSVMLALDVSASTLTGTRSQLRESIIAQVGAALTLIALNNNDKVGLVTYSDKLETYHPPRKARSAVWRILHEALSPGSFGTKTDLVGMCEFLNTVLRPSSVVFILSDFFLNSAAESNFSKALATLGKRHDVTAITVRDPADLVLPRAGLVQLRDPETNELTLLDTDDPQIRADYEKRSKLMIAAQKKLFRKCGVGHLELFTDHPFVEELERFLTRRSPVSRGQHGRSATAADSTAAI